MKDVYLFGPTIVRSGDTQSVRHPHDNPISVSDAEEKRLREQGVLAEPPATGGVAPTPPAPAAE